MDGKSLKELLAASALLRDINLPEEELALSCFKSGQLVSDHPRGIAAIGHIVSGRVDVFSVALDGRVVLLNTLSVGDCFGICNLLDRSELDTVLRCAADSEILFVPKSLLLDEALRNAGFATRLAALYSAKIQFLLHRIGLLTMQSCRARLIAFLLNEADDSGNICFRGSREELASHLGASRAALFRELAALQKAGLIRVTSKGFRLLDEAGLEALLYHPSNTK